MEQRASHSACSANATQTSGASGDALPSQPVLGEEDSVVSPDRLATSSRTELTEPAQAAQESPRSSRSESSSLGKLRGNFLRDSIVDGSPLKHSNSDSRSTDTDEMCKGPPVSSMESRPSAAGNNEDANSLNVHDAADRTRARTDEVFQDAKPTPLPIAKMIIL